MHTNIDGYRNRWIDRRTCALAPTISPVAKEWVAAHRGHTIAPLSSSSMLLCSHTIRFNVSAPVQSFNTIQYECSCS